MTMLESCRTSRPHEDAVGHKLWGLAVHVHSPWRILVWPALLSSKVPGFSRDGPKAKVVTFWGEA